MRTPIAVFLVASTLAASAAMGQWTIDPAVNTPVYVGGGDQGTPVLKPTPDGGAWISYTDNGAGSGYKHAVQRLDAAGNRQLGPGGVTINSRTNTATFVYDMDVDADGAALVAYDNSGIWIQKVNPDGSMPWGVEGVFMAGSAGAVGPRVCALTDGSAVVVWAQSNILNFRRVSAEGVVGSTWTLAETGRAQSPSDLLSTGSGGEFILLWIRAEGTNMVTSRKGLKIQKWDGADVPQWNGGVAVDAYASSATPGRGIQNGYFPQVVSDGAGGAVVSWYDTGADRNAWVQHYSGSGVARFAANGLAASATTSATEFRLSSAVAYDATSDTYTVAYERSNAVQSLFGVGAQKLSGAGVRLWTEAGREVLPIAGFHASFINVNGAPSGDSIVTWLQYTGTNSPMEVHSTRLSSEDGAAVWAPATLGVSTGATTKGRLAVINTAGSDMLIAAWADGASGAADILAQNINANGTTGPSGPACDAIDFNNDGLFPDTADIDDFLSVFSGGPCSNDPNCGDVDFNNDGLFPDTQDIDSLLSVFSGGPCL
ncbi:MAG TPA: hypothetical protein VHN77_09830 [Phycisphaerales bacterium]|nr:hypothetical protein [Phycisphaerales bacterium]